LFVWALAASSICHELSEPQSEQSVLLMIPFLIGSQIFLLRRTELYQSFADTPSEDEPPAGRIDHSLG